MIAELDMINCLECGYECIKIGPANKYCSIECSKKAQKRKYIMKNHKDKCVLCFSSENIELHHIIPVKYNEHDDTTISLCMECHIFITKYYKLLDFYGYKVSTDIL